MARHRKPRNGLMSKQMRIVRAGVIAAPASAGFVLAASTSASADEFSQQMQDQPTDQPQDQQSAAQSTGLGGLVTGDQPPQQTMTSSVSEDQKVPAQQVHNQHGDFQTGTWSGEEYIGAGKGARSDFEVGKWDDGRGGFMNLDPDHDERKFHTLSTPSENWEASSREKIRETCRSVGCTYVTTLSGASYPKTDAAVDDVTASDEPRTAVDSTGKTSQKTPVSTQALSNAARYDGYLMYPVMDTDGATVKHFTKVPFAYAQISNNSAAEKSKYVVAAP